MVNLAPPAAVSQILKNVHANAKGLHDAGFLDAITMRKFDALVEPQQPLSKYEQALAKQQAERNAK